MKQTGSRSQWLGGSRVWPAGFKKVGVGRSPVGLCIAITSLSLVACRGGGPEIRTRGLSVSADILANGDAPVRVDLVAIYDEALIEEFSAYTAREWFEQRSKLELIHQGVLDYCTIEPPPGADIHLDPLPLERDKGVRLFVYALYIEGGHRARLDQLERAVIQLNPTSISVQPLEGDIPEPHQLCEAPGL